MKVIIGRNTLGEMEYTQRANRKEQLFKNLVEYISKWIEPNYIDLDADGMKYFESVFYKKYSDSFPPTVSLSTMFNLSDVDVTKIQILLRQYNSLNIEGWDVEKMSAPEIDFNFYATNEDEIERYELSKALCDAVNTIKSEYQRTMFLGSLNRATSGVVEVSFHDSGLLIPSVDFILNEQ
jgi:hypothetical protein